MKKLLKSAIKYIDHLEAKIKAQQEVIDYCYSELGKYMVSSKPDLNYNWEKVDNVYKRIEKYYQEEE